jgi:isopentenyl diphosphate isomerase/L-lactate dehydrogenase-like FMN-dependent dehydrogenase
MQVSNHGGRQLDQTLGTFEALAEVVEAVGAQAVLIGRSHLWGLAIAGEAGVRHALVTAISPYDDRRLALPR